MATGTLQKNMVLLWTNASPTSEFTAKTISLDLAEYNFILVDCISFRNEPSHVSTICLNGLTTRINRIQPISHARKIIGVLRDAVVSTTGVQFSDALSGDVNNMGAIANSALIPYRIFGIKA